MIMNEIEKPSVKAENITRPETDFKGYTLEELRYQRGLTLLRREFCTSKINRTISNLRSTNPLSPSSAASSLPSKAGFVATKLLKGMNYLDYAVVGFSLFNSARKVLSIFKRKK